MASSPDVDANLIEAERLIGEAVEQGAELIVLPENFALMGMTEFDKLEHVETQGVGKIQQFLAQTAKDHSIWIVGGTIPIKASVERKVRATCLVFDAVGACVARYDKIHLFDVHVPGTEEQYRESDTIEAGQDLTVFDTPFGRMGLAVCYDLRFPEMFRRMQLAGAELIVIPSAFTANTGAAHWEVLIRARAIENLCHVVAADQGGFHENGRQTWGQSMIVDAWGRILAEIPCGSGIAVAALDPDALLRVRTTFPVLEHRRFKCKQTQ